MSYVGYVVEELMRDRQAEAERLAATYGERKAARAGRSAARRVRAASARNAGLSRQPADPAPC
jgi:hypothetical protein